MPTRSFRLSEQQASELQTAYLSSGNAATKTRYQAVRLYGLGYPVAQILDICGGSHSRLLEWTRAYRDGGLPALVDHRLGGNSAKLKPEQREALGHQLHTYTPAQLLGREACVGDGQWWTCADIARLLARDYEVSYQSPSSYSRLLARCGLSYQRPAKHYKSRSEVKVLEFEEALEKKRWMPLRTPPRPSG